MKVILLGSSGLIGRYCLKYLSNDLTVDAIKILNRKKSENNLLKVEETIVDFDAIENYRETIQGDYLICCLGTTMRKAKSKQAFRKVDLEYPVKTAQIAHQNGVKHFIVISSIGANKNSTSFYLKTKGEMEQQISQIGFESITILRPSFLFGDRDEFRLGEKIGIGLMKLIAPLLRGKLSKYKGIEAETIAIAITKLLKKPVSGKHIYESNQIHEMVYR